MNRRHLLALLAGTAAAPFVPAVAKAEPDQFRVMVSATEPSSPWVVQFIGGDHEVLRSVVAGHPEHRDGVWVMDLPSPGPDERYCRLVYEITSPPETFSVRAATA